jgi:hypothetical protein
MALPGILSAPAVVLIDTDVVFPPTTLTRLLDVVEAKDVGMATACTRDARQPGHYYDTFAYVGVDEDPTVSVSRRTCALKTCAQCRPRCRRGASAPINPKDPRPHVVASAFAGLAVLRPAALLSAEWRSDNNLCEHVRFCQEMRASGHQVVVAPTARAEWFDKFDDWPANARLAKIRALTQQTKPCPHRPRNKLSTTPVLTMSKWPSKLPMLPATPRRSARIRSTQ